MMMITLMIMLLACNGCMRSYPQHLESYIEKDSPLSDGVILGISHI